MPPVGLGATEITARQKSATSESTSDRMGHTGVLVPLEHQLSNPGVRIPELDATVLGSAQHPVTVRGESDAEDKILEKC